MLNVQSPVVMKSVLGSDRSAGVRGKFTSGGAGYGDARTEAAVQNALWWLKKKQNEDGSWKGWENGSPHAKSASTGLAILTFLAHGETPASKNFGPTVEKGIEWLYSNMKQGKDGVWHINDGGNEEYGFLIAIYALSEAYGMTKNPNAKEAAMNGLKRIIDSQSPTGGWNYRLAKIVQQPDDISYGGWCMQALKAGKLAGLHPDGMDECIKKAIKCLKERNYNKDHGFSYRPSNRGYAGLGGVGCLAMQLLGYGNDPAVRKILVACYAIGWRVTSEDVAGYPHLKPAQSENDTGVIITFDCEAEDVKSSLVVPEGAKTYSINPLNWRTDETPADRTLNKGALMNDGSIKAGLTGCYINKERGTLKVTDIAKDDYPPGPSCFSEGEYHIYDFRLFYRNLQENVSVRISAFIG